MALSACRLMIRARARSLSSRSTLVKREKAPRSRAASLILNRGIAGSSCKHSFHSLEKLTHASALAINPASANVLPCPTPPLSSTQTCTGIDSCPVLTLSVPRSRCTSDRRNTGVSYLAWRHLRVVAGTPAFGIALKPSLAVQDGQYYQ